MLGKGEAIVYAISARIERTTPDGWTGVRHLPTFYLDENVQGLLSEESACRVARAILDPYGEEGEGLQLYAVKTDAVRLD